MDECLSWAVLSSVFMWTTLYNVICLMNPECSYEWNCRIVTLMHAVVIVAFSSFFGFFYNPWPFTHPGGKTNIYENFTMVICIGYFIFDLFWCIYFFDKDSVFMILHHCATIIGIFGSLYTQRSGTEVNATIFGSELSNPMLQFRWFMRQMGKKNGIVYEVNDVIFMLTFLVCRMIIGTYFMYCEWQNSDPMIFFKVGSLCLWLISFVFAVQIVNFANFKYKKIYHAWKSNKLIDNHELNNVLKNENGAGSTAGIQVNASNSVASHLKCNGTYLHEKDKHL